MYRKKKVVQKLTRLTSEEPDPRPSSDIPLKSTLAKALVKVLGFNSDLSGIGQSEING